MKKALAYYNAGVVAGMVTEFVFYDHELRTYDLAAGRGGSGLIFWDLGWGSGFILLALVCLGLKNLLNKLGLCKAQARALLNK
jgi:hypothetical protein